MLQKRIIILLLSLLQGLIGMAQSDFLDDYNRKRERNFGKDFQNRESLTLDELMNTNRGTELRTTRLKRNVLVFENIRVPKRVKYFEGQIFRFKDSNGERHDKELASIDDSTFTISSYNPFSELIDYETFHINDVKKVYFSPKPSRKLRILTLLAVPLLSFGSYTYATSESGNSFGMASLIVGGNILLINRHRITHPPKAILFNRRVRILKSY